MTRVIAVILFCAGIFCLAAEPPVGQSHAQVPMTGAGVGAPGGGFTPSCTQSTTFLTAATGVTLTADKTNYDTLICGLVTDGVFSSLDVLYIWAAPTITNAALINLASPGTFNGTAHGTLAGTFTAYHGYTGNGSDFYIDTGFAANTAPSPHYVQDSATVGIYVLSNITGASAASFAAVDTDSATGARILPNFFNQTIYYINDTVGSSPASTTTQGQWVATRTASTTTTLYRNGNTTPFDSYATTSAGIPLTGFYLFASSAAGTPNNFSSIQMSAAFIGSGLSAANQNKVTARINTYMTAYGINVY